MPEDVVEAPAESSPAEPEPQPQIPSDPEAYAEWRQTGKLPDEKDKPSKRGASATPSKPSVGEEPEKGAPVSETGSSKGRNYEGRVKELVSKEKQVAAERDQIAAERDAYRAKLEALEAGKKDASVDSSSAPAKDAKAAPSPAPGSPQRPVKPKQDDFDGWDAYETAQDKYVEDLADWKAVQRIQADRQQRENDARLAEAEVRYGAEAKPKILEAAHVLWNDQGIVLPIKEAIRRSPVMVDALYVMNSDAKEFAEFVRLSKADPLEALRKWFTVEELVKQELGTSKSEAPQRGPDGKFLPEKPARRIAPAPPVELNGNSSPPGDQRERAAQTDNFRAFKEAGDRKDFAKYKGQG